MAIWGQPRKAGKSRRPEQVPAPRGGQASPGNAVAAAPYRYGPNPQSFDLAHRLGVGTTLPILRGRFRTMADASPSSRGNGAPDLGALQTFRGLVGLPTRRLRAGMQAGPSDQPGYPSTGAGNVIQGLANMSRPGVQRIRGL